MMLSAYNSVPVLHFLIQSGTWSRFSLNDAATGRYLVLDRFLALLYTYHMTKSLQPYAVEIIAR